MNSFKISSLSVVLQRNAWRYVPCRSIGTNGSSSSIPQESVYVHPLSQVCLMYLQSNCHDWIIKNKLEKSLKFHRDGTFVIEFPDKTAKIWTAYDGHDKKHWLNFEKGSVQYRYMLQDNLMPAWHGNKRMSLPERIHQSIDELIEVVDQLKD